MVAVLAHALALIRTRVYGIPTDANAVAVAALYHDATEILTGDMPTPIKYYNPEIRDAYRKVETVAGDKLLSMLDVLVDGRFVEELKDISLRFRGSSNQRLIDMKKTLAAGKIVLLPDLDRKSGRQAQT